MGTENSSIRSQLAAMYLGLNTGSGLCCLVLVAGCHCCWRGGGAGPEAATSAKEGFFEALWAFGAGGGGEGQRRLVGRPGCQCGGEGHYLCLNGSEVLAERGDKVEELLDFLGRKGWRRR